MNKDEQLAELAGIYRDTLNAGHGIITRFEQGNRAAEATLAAGYRKLRTVSTIDELDALLQGDANVALMDEDGLILQNLVGGWATPISTRFMSSETVHRGFGPDFTVLHEGVTP